MKIKNKLLSIISLAASTTATISIINQITFKKSLESFPRKSFVNQTYHWRFGDICYTQCGTGRPILLVHSLNSYSSHYEWNKIIQPLAKNRTVYTIDLLGCGYSEKPDFVYTNFLFVQLISDFITNVIGRRTDIVTSGDSSSIALMSCIYNSDLFDKIMMINPSPISHCNQIPSKTSKLCRFYYNLPVYGTFAYNIALSKNCIKEELYKHFADDSKVNSEMIHTFYKNAHIGNKNAKYLYSSIKGNYTNVAISKMLKQINHCIYILGGKSAPNIRETIIEYQTFNPSIESSIVPDCKDMIALENPKAVLEMIQYI